MIDFKLFTDKYICVAVSGGADSTALLHYLKAESKIHGFKLCAVNCEHGIRGKDSLDDTNFVIELCKEWDISLYTFSTNCIKEAKDNKISLETAARNFRYRCFNSLLNEQKVDYIATAHHADDEAETVLFRLARGTSLSGIKGMREISGNYIRPFLYKTKKDILQYCKDNSLQYCEDMTNYERDVTRNKIRLDIMPEIEKAVPGAVNNFIRFADIASEDDAFLYDSSKILIKKVSIESSFDTGYRIDLSIKESDYPSLFRRATLLILKDIGVEKDYTFSNLQSVYELKNMQTGSEIDLPLNIKAVKVYDTIAFYKKQTNLKDEIIQEFELGKFDIGMYSINVTKEKPSDNNFLMFDMDKLPKNAMFRCKRMGDSFLKFGGGRKTLKKYLVDKKIPSCIREELPLVADKNSDEVYIVCGVEISDLIKTDEDTKNPCYITIDKRK